MCPFSVEGEMQAKHIYKIPLSNLVGRSIERPLKSPLINKVVTTPTPSMVAPSTLIPVTHSLSLSRMEIKEIASRTRKELLGLTEEPSSKSESSVKQRKVCKKVVEEDLKQRAASSDRMGSESADTDSEAQRHCSSSSEAEPERVGQREESPPFSGSFEEDILDLNNVGRWMSLLIDIEICNVQFPKLSEKPGLHLLQERAPHLNAALVQNGHLKLNECSRRGKTPRREEASRRHLGPVTACALLWLSCNIVVPRAVGGAAVGSRASVTACRHLPPAPMLPQGVAITTTCRTEPGWSAIRSRLALRALDPTLMTDSAVPPADDRLRQANKCAPFNRCQALTGERTRQGSRVTEFTAPPPPISPLSLINGTVQCVLITVSPAIDLSPPSGGAHCSPIDSSTLLLLLPIHTHVFGAIRDRITKTTATQHMLSSALYRALSMENDMEMKIQCTVQVRRTCSSDPMSTVWTGQHSQWGFTEMQPSNPSQLFLMIRACRMLSDRTPQCPLTLQLSRWIDCDARSHGSALVFNQLSSSGLSLQFQEREREREREREFREREREKWYKVVQ
ncbi:hypothetical protein JZ751_012359 [Albula glossodonta]|uniref:Uncharacterized protein n=1 Tax=Albula glossodonta TaxID=121402 RepID=A0A8T2PSA1_9TELE|nr:hypothetical protein JZ751_012359 [Albula glossodonta]